MAVTPANKIVRGNDLTAIGTAIKSALARKADYAKTLTGYGITDAYTIAQVDTAIANALASMTAENISSALGYAPTSQEDIEKTIDAVLYGTFDGLTAVEAAISDGNSWIDTGLTGSGDMRIMAKLGAIPYGNISASVVAHVDQSNRMGFMVFNTASHKVAYFWPGIGYSELTLNANIDLSKPFEVVQDADGISVRQGTYISSAAYRGTTAAVNANIHVLHSQNANHVTYQYGTIYSVVIERGNDTLLKLQPVVRMQDGKVGCYDEVSEGFLPSSGTGNFIAGKETDGVVGGKEDKSNKVTQLTEHSTDVEYPSAKATYDEVHPSVGLSQPAGGMLPNVVYKLGTLSDATAFTLASPTDNNIANHYFWTFETGSTAPTITWPAGISSWYGGAAPEIAASKHYEVSVLDGVAICMEV